MMAPALVAHGLNTLLAGLAMALFAWGFLRWLAPTSSVRFAVWFSSLVGIAALPFVPTSFSSGSASGAPGQPEFTFPVLLAVYLFIGWAVMALLLLARVGVSLWHVSGLRRRAAEIDASVLDPALLDALRDGKPRRAVQLCISEDLRTPAALGFFRPAIVIPRWAWEELTSDELRIVVLHELSHLKRWDDWTNLAQQIIKALFFFHPAVWWIDRRLTLEREMACDDMVLAQVASPKAYAASLISLAERVHLGRGVALVQALVGRARQTTARITQILDPNRPNNPARVWKPVFSSFAGVAVLMILVVPRSPQWVAFEDQTLPAVETRAASAPETLSSPSVGSAPTILAKQSAPPRRTPAVVATAHTRPFARRSAGVFQASTKATAPSSAQIVLVVQTTEYMQYGSSGEAVVTFTVWRVREVNRSQQGSSETVAKKL